MISKLLFVFWLHPTADAEGDDVSLMQATHGVSKVSAETGEDGEVDIVERQACDPSVSPYALQKDLNVNADEKGCSSDNGFLRGQAKTFDQCHQTYCADAKFFTFHSTSENGRASDGKAWCACFSACDFARSADTYNKKPRVYQFCESNGEAGSTGSGAASTGSGAGSQTCGTDEEATHFGLVNQLRAQGFTCPAGNYYPPNSVPLVWNCKLHDASQLHSQDMADRGYFSHTSKAPIPNFALPSGSPWNRASNSGISANGENIAAGTFSDATAVLEQWKGSDGHCNNIMNPNFKTFAVGHAYKSSSQYKNYWTQMFKITEVEDKSCCSNALLQDEDPDEPVIDVPVTNPEDESEDGHIDAAIQYEVAKADSGNLPKLPFCFHPQADQAVKDLVSLAFSNEGMLASLGITCVTLVKGDYAADAKSGCDGNRGVLIATGRDDGSTASNLPCDKGQVSGNVYVNTGNVFAALATLTEDFKEACNCY